MSPQVKNLTLSIVFKILWLCVLFVQWMQVQAVTVAVTLSIPRTKQ